MIYKRAFFLILSALFVGCSQPKELEQARSSWRQSEAEYELAVKAYQQIAAGGPEAQAARMELGEIYFKKGLFNEAIEQLKELDQPQARKLTAIAYYRLGSYTEALEAFNASPAGDEEYQYYLGLTSEKLNLFDKALSCYRAVRSGPLASAARQRIESIEKKVTPVKIESVSPRTAEILKAAPDPALYPQAGAQILLVDEAIEVTPDNKELSRMHYLVKILNERGKEEFSESHIEYDSTFERVEIKTARTIKPDGTVVDVGSRHIRDVSKYMNFPLYSNARVAIISFPEIAEGAAIEYEVNVYRSELINKKDFVLAYPVQSSEPIIRAALTVTVPADKPVAFKVINQQYNNFGGRLSPVQRQEGSKKTYSWEFSDIPQVIPEPNMPPMSEINPTILMSTFASWQEIYSWWRGLAEDKIQADDDIRKKVIELTSGLSAAKEKAAAIHAFCAKEIRYVAVEYGQAGYEPHRAADVFRNKYGDCKDQAILLVTMLRFAGCKAWPVLIPTRDYLALNEDFPSMLFNHAIACVEVDGETIFMDPTAETCAFADLPSGDQGRAVLVVREDGYAIASTPLFAAAHNLARQTLSITVTEDEQIKAQRAVESFGVYDQAQRYWLLYTLPELVSDQLQAKIQDISIGSVLSGYEAKNLDDLAKPVVLRYSFSGPEYFTAAGSLRIMPQLAGVDSSVVAKQSRKYPLDFEILDEKQQEVSIVLPKNFVVKYMPEDIALQSPWLSYSGSYKKEGGALVFKQRVVQLKNVVAQQDYPLFKAFIEELAKKVKQRVVLEKAK